MTHQDSKNKFFRFEAIALVMAMAIGGIYVALKTAMDDIGPFSFLTLLFIFALPVPWFCSVVFETGYFSKNWRKIFYYSCIPAVCATFGSALLQLALVTSAAGRAGLISSLYVCILPFASVFIGYKLKLSEIVGAFVAFIGLYFLSVRGDFSISLADLLLLASAFCWTAELLAVDYGLRYVKPFSFSLGQGLVGVLPFLVITPYLEPESIIAMQRDFVGLMLPILPELLYGGVFGGIIFALGVYLQQHISPNRIGLIYSTESLFAVLAGWFILKEVFSGREFVGMVLMFSALLIVRLDATLLKNIFPNADLGKLLGRK